MTPPAQTAAFPKNTIRQAVSEGKAQVKDGKTKVEAATAMFKTLKGADRDTVVTSFMEGGRAP